MSRWNGFIYALCFLANKSSLASSTLIAELDLSYIMMTNLSKLFTSLSSTLGGYWLSLVNVSSLKVDARSKRGNGIRRRVTSRGKILSNRHTFLRDNDNKTELFNFLAENKADFSEHHNRDNRKMSVHTL